MFCRQNTSTFHMLLMIRRKFLCATLIPTIYLTQSVKVLLQMISPILELNSEQLQKISRLWTVIYITWNSY